jgi:predicted O-methyltransferase YrrM
LKHIIFCLPGAPTLNNAMSWDDMRTAFAQKGDLRMTVVRGGGSSVVHLRNDILAHEVVGPKKYAKPFGGLDYDFMMWIDSDSVYRPDDFFKLLNLDVDIATGIVPIDLEPGRAAAGNIDLAKGITSYLRLGMIGPEPFEVGWCGFAFLLVRHGVFETLDYPWFDLPFYTVGESIVYPGEDISWCMRVRKLGYKIIAHPGVRVDHEKLLIMQAPDPEPTNDMERFIRRYDHAWRMSEPALKAIGQVLNERKPRKVLEFGPGASSFVILPWCLANGAVYRALDHEGPYAQNHLANLREAGLPTESTLTVPLQGHGWYTAIPDAVSREGPYDLIIVDGPVAGRGCPEAMAAYGALGYPQTAWVFDDVNRQEEMGATGQVQMMRGRPWLQSIIIQDPEYPRQTALLVPEKVIDEQGMDLDTISLKTDAEAVGQSAPRGQPEAIA